MKDVSFSRYSPDKSDRIVTTQLVECYRDVFADRPWNEWLKCPVCGKYWGIKDKDHLTCYKFHHCGVPLVDFWPREEVLADLSHEIVSGSSCWLAMNKESIIGFCWGYPIKIDDLETKLGIPIISNLGYLDIYEQVAYQDEVGVISSYRGRKVAKAMVIRRLDDFIAQGLQCGIVRTKQSPEPSETFLWYTQKLGYEILAKYPGDDGRVVLGRKLAGLKELLLS